jgi:hypothetical protein
MHWRRRRPKRLAQRRTLAKNTTGVRASQQPRRVAAVTSRVWAKLHRLILDELGSRGDLDWPRCAIDSVNMRALKGGS